MLCFDSIQIDGKLGRLGDYSYAIYLWGWPVQQMVVWVNGGSMNVYEHVLISLPIVFIMAFGTRKINEYITDRFLGE